MNIFLKSFKKFIDNKNIKTNIYRVQAYDSIVFKNFNTEVIDFIVNNTRLADFTSSKQFRKNMMKWYSSIFNNLLMYYSNVRFV